MRFNQATGKEGFMLPYFDAHCDTIAAMAHRGGELLHNDYHVDLTRLETYAPRAQVFALFGNIGDRNRVPRRKEDAFKYITQILQYLQGLPPRSCPDCI